MADDPSAPGKRLVMSPPPSSEPRLESWGEVASYLRRDIRTVQRWEKEQGLPVRRLVIGKQGQVYAYRSELDRWMLERQPKVEGEEPSAFNEAPPLVSPDNHETEGALLVRFTRLWKPALAVLSVLPAAVYFILFLHPSRPKNNLGPVPTKILLFVRPFTSLNPTEKEFVDGLTDEVITQLGRVDPKSIGVFAPTTSKELATKNIQELRNSLNANFVLEGSVRRASEQIRIDINLISTADQTPAWTNSYTGNLGNVLAFQDAVAIDVAKHLILALPALNTPGNTERPSIQAIPRELPGPPGASMRASVNTAAVDPQVYEAYLSGRVYLLDRDFPRSMDAFQRALQKDSQYAPALVGLSMSVLLLAETPNDALRPTDAMPKARQAAYQGLGLNPNLSDAYCVLANIAQAYDHDLPEAERLYKKAIYLDPSNVTALKWYSDYLFVTNRLPEAMKEIDRALELDPASPLLNTAKAEVKYYQRDFDGAIAQAQRTLSQHPEFLLARFWLASAYRQKKMFPEAIQQFAELHKGYPDNSAMLMAYGHALAVSGDQAGAKKILGELQAQSPSHYVPALYIAGIYAGLADVDQAFHWLDRAYAEKNDRLVYLGVDPLADPLRSDPRFSVLMKKVGLP